MKKILGILLIGLFVMSETAWGIKLSQLDKDLMSACDTNKLDKIKKYTPQDIAKSLNFGLFSRAINKDAINTIKYFLNILITISLDKEPTALADSIKEPLETFQQKHSADSDLEAKIKAFLENFASKTEQPTIDLKSAFTTYSKTQSAENSKILIELIKKEASLKDLQELQQKIDIKFTKSFGEEDSEYTKQIKAVLASAIIKLDGQKYLKNAILNPDDDKIAAITNAANSISILDILTKDTSLITLALKIYMQHKDAEPRKSILISLLKILNSDTTDAKIVALIDWANENFADLIQSGLPEATTFSKKFIKEKTETPEIAKLKTELGQLKGSLSSLQKKLNTLNAKLAKLQTKLA